MPLVPNLLAVGAVALLWGGHIVSPVIVSGQPGFARAHAGNTRKFIGVPLGLLAASLRLGALGDLSQWPGISRDITGHLNPRLSLFYGFSVEHVAFLGPALRRPVDLSLDSGASRETDVWTKRSVSP